MPIPSDSTEILVPDVKALPAGQVYVDVEEMHVGRPATRGGTPSLNITATEYVETEAGRVYSANSEAIVTADLFRLAGVCPPVAVAVAAIFAAVPAVRALKRANAVKLQQAQQQLVAAQADAAAKADAVSPLATARTLAFGARNQVRADAASTQEQKDAAESAWTQADAAWQAAVGVAQAAVAAVAAAEARVAIAQAAVEDPANPSLADEVAGS